MLSAEASVYLSAMRKDDPKPKRSAEMRAYIRSLRGKYAGLLGGKTATEIKAETRAEELSFEEAKFRQFDFALWTPKRDLLAKTPVPQDSE